MRKKKSGMGKILQLGATYGSRGLIKASDYLPRKISNSMYSTKAWGKVAHTSGLMEGDRGRRRK